MTDPHRLKRLPLLTNEELEVLYEVLDEACGDDGPRSARRWNILNSLRTAVGEAKANGG